jgi:hypothetical protein
MQYTDTKNLNNLDIENLEDFLNEDWNDCKDKPELLTLWADLLHKNNLIKQGKVPNNFTAITHCIQCGYVYVPPALVNGSKVFGCPWCWSRVKNLTIPKPIQPSN